MFVLRYKTGHEEGCLSWRQRCDHCCSSVRGISFCKCCLLLIPQVAAVLSSQDRDLAAEVSAEDLPVSSLAGILSDLFKDGETIKITVQVSRKA